MNIPHANLHPEEYEWLNIDTDETRPATESVPLWERWRLRRRTIDTVRPRRDNSAGCDAADHNAARFGGPFAFPGHAMAEDELLDKLEAALDAGRGISLSAQEVDDLLWLIGEQEIAIHLQRHMITLLEIGPASQAIN